MWVFIIFVCKPSVINLMMVTAGLRESERSKANRRKPDTQVIEGSVISENDIQKYIYDVPHLIAFVVLIFSFHFRRNKEKRASKSLELPSITLNNPPCPCQQHLQKMNCMKSVRLGSYYVHRRLWDRNPN